MATRDFDVNWMGQYRNGTYYGGGSPIRAGNGYDSLLGAPAAMRDAIKASTSACTVTLHVYMTDPGTVDWGAHNEVTNKATGSTPWYEWLRESTPMSSGWRTYGLSNVWMPKFVSGAYEGVVMYSTNSYSEATGTSGENRAFYRVTGSWGTMHVKAGTTWREGQMHVKVGTTWRAAKQVWVNVNGTWRPAK